jgi:hypothetical protein
MPRAGAVGFGLFRPPILKPLAALNLKAVGPGALDTDIDL